ncbi:MAG: flagellar export chaperone FlgN [Verrucomicrobia bacterium]|nr:flagellar export chaperone FlgN [Verrucomicrobiota bacterium]
MEHALLKRLRDGIQEEIEHYEQLLDLTTREHEILAEESYSTELATLAATKLKVMRDINDLSMRIGPLKVRWKLEVARIKAEAQQRGDGEEISPLLDTLGSLLGRILDVDEENQRILSRLVHSSGAEGANRRLSAASAEKAYGKTGPNT